MASNSDVSTPGVAAFDFDGTLVGGDSLPLFIALVRGRVGFIRILAESAPSMIGSYRRGGRDASKAALLQRSLGGLQIDPVLAEGRRFAGSLMRRVKPDMAERLAWHEANGHRRILVSASLAVYLEPFGKLAGFDEVIATELEERDGRFTGRIAGSNVRGEEKASRLAEVLGAGPHELWAYGNSAGDLEMLAMADHPTMVRRFGARGRGLRG